MSHFVIYCVFIYTNGLTRVVFILYKIVAFASNVSGISMHEYIIISFLKCPHSLYLCISTTKERRDIGRYRSEQWRPGKCQWKFVLQMCHLCGRIEFFHCCFTRNYIKNVIELRDGMLTPFAMNYSFISTYLRRKCERMKIKSLHDLFSINEVFADSKTNTDSGRLPLP